MTDTAVLSETLALRDQIAQRVEFNRLEDYVPYPWQADFHAGRDEAGTFARQILLLAANQVGKSKAGAADDAYHLTGRYPRDWVGPKYNQPITMIVGSPTTQLTKDVLQRQLFGGDPDNPEEFGTGMIPRDCLLDGRGRPRAERWVGVPGGISEANVRHVSGKTSKVLMRTYEQGAAAWMGIKADEVHADEEPPRAIYSQAMRATIATQGRIKITMTPENGMTDVVREFLQDLKPGQKLVRATWEDAPHLTEEGKAQLLAALPPHEREMRSKGIPLLGSGLIFPVSWDELRIAPFSIPETWPRIAGLDFGQNHAFAAAWWAFDLDAKVAYWYDAYKKRETALAVHVAALKTKGAWIEFAWPHDGGRRVDSTIPGSPTIAALLSDPRGFGLRLLSEHFTNPDSRDNYVDPGLAVMLNAMQLGQIRVFSHLNEVRDELSLYHRKDGQIVKKDDDLMSAGRIGYLSSRFARAPRSDEREFKPVYASGVDDYDPRVG